VSERCAVCIDRLAVAVARHQKRDETWLVCGTCRNQGVKHKARVDYEALPR
jgi:hypothetical protein